MKITVSQFAHYCLSSRNHFTFIIITTFFLPSFLPSSFLFLQHLVSQTALLKLTLWFILLIDDFIRHKILMLLAHKEENESTANIGITNVLHCKIEANCFYLCYIVSLICTPIF